MDVSKRNGPNVFTLPTETCKAIFYFLDRFDASALQFSCKRLKATACSLADSFHPPTINTISINASEDVIGTMEVEITLPGYNAWTESGPQPFRFSGSISSLRPLEDFLRGTIIEKFELYGFVNENLRKFIGSVAAGLTFPEDREGIFRIGISGRSHKDVEDWDDIFSHVTPKEFGRHFCGTMMHRDGDFVHHQTAYKY
ncbi:hypothetical protein AAVH_24507 [Aphelenchoides avenae]|nr:hypothetical protein AAVH_25430 [Aphelenchus avenae]KAH7708237.1 hypothetical protein AAVH_24507 [Aphelenchus avenae]